MNILFLCTGNSCRSQMAEAWGKTLRGEEFNFYSAGTERHGLNPRAVQVMREVGVDISGYHSKRYDEVLEEMSVIFTVCSDAEERCPISLQKKTIHVGFDDPPRLTIKMIDEEEVLAVYRRVRDEIRAFIEKIESHLENTSREHI